MAATSNVISNNGIRYDIYLTNDGLDESAVTKVDISTLTLNNGKAPSQILLEYVQASVSGAFDFVELLWDKTATDQRMVLLPSGNHDLCFHPYLKPSAAAGSNDVLLTTSGTADATAAYSIHLRFKLVE